MILLDPGDVLQLVTDSAANIDVFATYEDRRYLDGVRTAAESARRNAAWEPWGRQLSSVSSSTTTDIVASPPLGTKRKIGLLTVKNRDASLSCGVIIKHDDGATAPTVFGVTLLAGECLSFTDGSGWRVTTEDGESKAPSTTYVAPAVTTGKTMVFQKSGTAAEATGVPYCFLKDAGLPGAWTPGTPGVNGANVVAPTFSGGIAFGTPATAHYLTRATANLGVAGTAGLFDLLWYNTGLVVTTVGPQAIVTAAFPARDRDGSTNGEGLLIGLYVTGATTNAGAISNSTVSYVNSTATGGTRTATLVATSFGQIPATAVAGTLIWFSLQAGDTGVRSISSISLGTSLAAGSVSLIVARPLLYIPVPTANTGVETAGHAERLYTGSYLVPWYVPTATTALTCSGTVTVEDR